MRGSRRSTFLAARCDYNPTQHTRLCQDFVTRFTLTTKGPQRLALPRWLPLLGQQERATQERATRPAAYGGNDTLSLCAACVDVGGRAHALAGPPGQPPDFSGSTVKRSWRLWWHGKAPLAGI